MLRQTSGDTAVRGRRAMVMGGAGRVAWQGALTQLPSAGGGTRVEDAHAVVELEGEPCWKRRKGRVIP